MKRLLAMTLAIILVLSMTACKNNKEQNSGNGVSNNEIQAELPVSSFEERTKDFYEVNRNINDNVISPSFSFENGNYLMEYVVKDSIKIEEYDLERALQEVADGHKDYYIIENTNEIILVPEMPKEWVDAYTKILQGDKSNMLKPVSLKTKDETEVKVYVTTLGEYNTMLEDIKNLTFESNIEEGAKTLNYKYKVYDLINNDEHVYGLKDYLKDEKTTDESLLYKTLNDEIVLSSKDKIILEYESLSNAIFLVKEITFEELYNAMNGDGVELTVQDCINLNVSAETVNGVIEQCVNEGLTKSFENATIKVNVDSITIKHTIGK